MASNSILVPSAVLAAVASSSPEASIGPKQRYVNCVPHRVRGFVITCDNHHLSTVLIVKSMRTFARQDMCSNLSNILLTVSLRQNSGKVSNILRGPRGRTYDSRRWVGARCHQTVPVARRGGGSLHRSRHYQKTLVPGS